MNWIVAFAISLAPGREGWMGVDKVKHFAAAAVIQSLAYTAWREAGASPPGALWGASAVTAAASLGKELHDRRRGGAFSGKDLAWDAAGAGTATLAIIHRRRR